MFADYSNNPLMPFKWYVVARTREKRLFQKLDIFMYLSMTHDNAFELLYVSIDEINRRMTKCYHGKFVIKTKKNYLIVWQGLWRKKFIIIAQDDESEIIALSNRRKSKVWIMSRELPYDKVAFEKICDSLNSYGFDMNSIDFI